MLSVSLLEEENIGINLHALEFDNGFSYMSWKAGETKEFQNTRIQVIVHGRILHKLLHKIYFKIVILGFIKIENLLQQRTLTGKMKRQPTKWVWVFENYLSDKVLGSARSGDSCSVRTGLLLGSWKCFKTG